MKKIVLSGQGCVGRQRPKWQGRMWRQRAEKPVRGERRTRAPCAAWSWWSYCGCGYVCAANKQPTEAPLEKPVWFCTSLPEPEQPGCNFELKCDWPPFRTAARKTASVSGGQAHPAHRVKQMWDFHGLCWSPATEPFGVRLGVICLQMDA